MLTPDDLDGIGHHVCHLVRAWDLGQFRQQADSKGILRSNHPAMGPVLHCGVVHLVAFGSQIVIEFDCGSELLHARIHQLPPLLGNAQSLRQAVAVLHEHVKEVALRGDALFAADQHYKLVTDLQVLRSTDNQLISCELQNLVINGPAHWLRLPL